MIPLIGDAEPPATILQRAIEAKGWTPEDFAFVVGFPDQKVNKLLNGRTGLSAETAKVLAEAFGTPAALWLGRQKAWELHCAPDSDPLIQERAQK